MGVRTRGLDIKAVRQSPRRAFLCRVEDPDRNEGGLLFPNPERYEAGPERLNFDSTRLTKVLCGERAARGTIAIFSCARVHNWTDKFSRPIYLFIAR
jgi:hypothetical protein